MLDASEITAAPKPEVDIIVFHKPGNLSELIAHRAARVQDALSYGIEVKIHVIGDSQKLLELRFGHDFSAVPVRQACASTSPFSAYAQLRVWFYV